MKSFKNLSSRGLDWALAGILGALAAVLFFTGLIDYVMPGESAMMINGWNGIDQIAAGYHPVCGWFYRHLHLGQALAPLAGCLAVFAIFHLSCFFIREHVGGDHSEKDALVISRIGGVIASIVFMLTPCIYDAATHLDPRLFDATWLLLTTCLIFPFIRLPKVAAILTAGLMGVLAALAAIDSPVLYSFFPLFVAAIWIAALKRDGKAFCVNSVVLFTSLYFVTMLIALGYFAFGAPDGFGSFMSGQRAILRTFAKADGLYVMSVFAVLPFFISLFSARNAFSGEREWMNISYHGMMTLVSILAIATSFSPSAIFANGDNSPVLASIYVAFTAGYLMSYWWCLTRTRLVNESTGKTKGQAALPSIGWSVIGAYSLILVLAMAVNLTTINPDRGRYASSISDFVIAEMGAGRDWIYTDGSFDAQLREAAARAGRAVRIVTPVKDMDQAYCQKLAEFARADGVEEEVVKDLLEQGAAGFLRAWPAQTNEVVKAKLVVFTDPPMQMSDALIPEILFYSFDPTYFTSRSASEDLQRRKEAVKLFAGAKKWGSYGHRGGSDHALDLRRRFGRLTCMRGSTEAFEAFRIIAADTTKAALSSAAVSERLDAASDFYDLVLDAIDFDNVVARLNQNELADMNCKKAMNRREDNRRFLERVAADTSRRYLPEAVQQYYGSFINRRMMFERGKMQASFGANEMGIAQFNRILQYVPVEQRAFVELNYLAPLYAEGRADSREKAEQIYLARLKEIEAKKGTLSPAELKYQHASLVGLARLAMLAGDNQKAVTYLEKALDQAGGYTASLIEIATLHLVRGDLDKAEEVVQKAIEQSMLIKDSETESSDRERMKAYSLLMTTLMAKMDNVRKITNEDERVLRLQDLKDQIEEKVLPEMKKLGPDDPAYLTALAFFQLRKGGIDNLKASRDNFRRVARLKPESAITSDMLLSLEVSLGDRKEAVERAKRILRTDRRAPFANWVLGSVAMSDGNLEDAEMHLRVSYAVPQPSYLVLNDLADLLRRTKNYADAEAIARDAIRVDPKIWYAYDTLGNILIEAGDASKLEEAEMHIRKAYEITKGRLPAVKLSLARVLLKRGNRIEAKKILQQLRNQLNELDEQSREQFESLLKLA